MLALYPGPLLLPRRVQRTQQRAQVALAFKVAVALLAAVNVAHDLALRRVRGRGPGQRSRVVSEGWSVMRISRVGCRAKQTGSCGDGDAGEASEAYRERYNHSGS